MNALIICGVGLSTDVGFAFDAGVPRCMKGNTPRRVTKIDSPSEALKSWSRLIGEVSEALDMFTLERFHDIRGAMERLSQQAPNILTCSFLQLHFYQDDLTLGRHFGKYTRSVCRALVRQKDLGLMSVYSWLLMGFRCCVVS